MRFLNIHRSAVLTALAWLVPHVCSCGPHSKREQSQIVPSAVSVITSGGLTARTIRISSGKIKTGGGTGFWRSTCVSWIVTAGFKILKCSQKGTRRWRLLTEDERRISPSPAYWFFFWGGGGGGGGGWVFFLLLSWRRVINKTLFFLSCLIGFCIPLHPAPLLS